MASAGLNWLVAMDRYHQHHQYPPSSLSLSFGWTITMDLLKLLCLATSRRQCNIFQAWMSWWQLQSTSVPASEFWLDCHSVFALPDH